MNAWLLTLWLTAQPASGKFEAGQKAFFSGDIGAALKAFDAALKETGEPAVLERIHLWRGQCFAAKQDFSRAEDAFALALDMNPEASLDASKIDPSVVKLLDALKARTQGTLAVATEPQGAQLFIDGVDAGTAPLQMHVPVGRHHVEAVWDRGRVAAPARVFPRRVTEVSVGLAPSAPIPCPTPDAVKEPIAPAAQTEPLAPQTFRIVPFADARALVSSIIAESGPEVGVGVQVPFVRASVHFRPYPYVGLTPRVTAWVALVESLQVQVAAEAPLYFRSSGTAVGLSGLLGASWAPLAYFALYAEVGAQHLFANPGNLVPSRFVGVAGVRLTWP